MKNFEYYKESDLPEPTPLPAEYNEITLKMPFGQGRYKLKCRVLKKAKESTLIEAYSRLVRVGCEDGIHWQSINVKPYTRRVPTRYVESDRYFS